MPIGQDNELAVFLIALAVIFVVVIALAAVAIMRRNKRGRTLQNSTYGNNIDSGKEVPTDRSNEKYSYNAGDYGNSQANAAHQDANVHEHSHSSGSSADFGSGGHSGGHHSH
jgi:hypothetical protein